MASIVKQVLKSVNNMDKIGVSKKGFRDKGISPEIHSYKQKQACESAGINFAKWARDQYGVKKLHQLTEDHYKGYLTHLQENGASLGHLRNVETALKLVNRGFNKESERLGLEKVEFVPDKRVIYPATRTENVQNRSYSDSEIQQVYAKMSLNMQNAVQLMCGLGLRSEEAASIRVEHFQGNRLVIGKGEGITKGGRFREFEIPAKMQPVIQKMIAGKNPTDRLVPMSKDSVRKLNNDAFKKAGLKTNGRGCHGYRHAYARDRVKELMTPAEQQVLVRSLERYGEGKNADYGAHNRALYNSMKSKMDRIHSELGHGKNRFDLAYRYMR